jgi:hypothetical protein
METTLFGRRFQEVVARLEGRDRSGEMIALTAHVARAIYEGEKLGSRDIYRMLVQESGWTPERYEKWLSDTLLNALVNH